MPDTEGYPSPDPRHPDPDKPERVRRMFAAIHGHYDRMNRLMTLGRDLAWRRAALRETNLPPDGLLLDVATGSGDVLVQAMRLVPGARAVGVDFTPEMLGLAQARLVEAGYWGRFALLQGDALSLPFPDGTFDAVISAFMMRNVADVRLALAEQRRVVRPGGRVVCLELTWPRHPAFQRLFGLYFQRFVPWMGGLLSGHREAYRYLPASVASFYTREEMLSFMEGAGLAHLRCRTLMLGTVAIYTGERV
ncbi:MAG: ubiquinone/menaquinone biosynthesis methyltransferase [Anaerolineae bacterium]|nr:ubiquinone/menaquinone biosynthesis methyltransferase [Anaerolineae bacterium]